MAKRTILKTWLVISIFLVVSGGPATVAGKTIYVDDDATGANDGSSWMDAYMYLQDALADADSAEKPVEIRVAQGIYKPNQGVNISQVIFSLINEVTLVSGYAGVNEHDPNERNIQLYETLLSGDLAGNDIDVNNLSDLLNEPTHSDNGPIIYSGYSINQTAVLDGFVITGGRNTAVPFEVIVGGGGIIIGRGSSPTISNCTFIGNAALACGGGMLTKKNSSPIVTNCKFIRNYAGSGGGVYNVNSSPVFINCTFTHNCADNGAGMGISYWETTQARNTRLIDCIFEDNNAKSSGGGLIIYGDEAVLTNCVFIGNSASKGGGLYNNSGGLNLTNCQFIGNYAQEEGGGVAGSNSTLIDCIFIDNSSNGYGGGLAGNNSIYNCIISGNTAVNNGGAIYGWGEVINCTVISNRAGGNGGGIYTQGIVTLTNNIIRYNKALLGNEIYAGLIYKRVRGAPPIIISGTSVVTVRYNNILGGEENIPIETDCSLAWESGNLDIDPLFVDPGYWANADDPNVAAEPNDPNAVWVEGDYHLKSQAGRWNPNSRSWVQDDVTSPCIDTGDPNSPIGHEPFPNGGIINIGAYGGTVEASISTNYYSEFLESAVKMAGSTRGPSFRIVRFDATETPWPNFWPIRGLDSPQAVPYLVNVLENGPAWTDENLLKARGGIYPHIARCYAALCLGIIGDSRAFESLISILQYGDYIEDQVEITYERKDQYHISEYTALALGYLGDPNAVDPLIDVLEKGEREWTIYGLTILRDVKAIKPIIEYLSINNKFDRRFHSCLEHISRAFLPIKYSSNTRKYTIIDFPELGEFEGNKVHQALWEHWLVIGDEFAREQFEENYPKWTLLIQERPDDQFSQDWAIFRMVRGGVPALPYVMDQIDKGDESLLPAVELIRKGKPVAGCSSRMPEENRIEMLLWWTENKHKWLIFDIQEPNNSGI